MTEGEATNILIRALETELSSTHLVEAPLMDAREFIYELAAGLVQDDAVQLALLERTCERLEASLEGSMLGEVIGTLSRDVYEWLIREWSEEDPEGLDSVPALRALLSGLVIKLQARGYLRAAARGGAAAAEWN